MQSEPRNLRDLVILGGGPAGMAAALSARANGVESITIIDERPSLGGQVFKQLPREFRAPTRSHSSSHDQRGPRLVTAVEKAGIEILLETAVWGLWDGPLKRVAAFGGGQAINLDARRLIVATGAYDRPVAFPGWDLPGVITAGAAQTLVKTQRILPGRRILLAGAGPLVLAFATEMHRAGANVIGVLEANPRPGIMRAAGLAASAMGGSWGQLLTGVQYLRYLRTHNISVRYSHGIKRAEGTGRVARATIQRLDANWHAVQDTEQTLDIDTLCLGYGLVSSVEALRLLGCQMVYDESRGGPIPRRDDDFQTSVSGVYAIGDCAGVDGAEVSIVEGEIAGAAIRRSLALPVPASISATERGARIRLRRLRRFRAALNNAYPIRDGYHSWRTGDTILCRCEEVTFDEARRALRIAADASSMKATTRAGMGPCQGRMCSRNVRKLVTDANGGAVEQQALATPRPPIRPVPLGVIASAATSESRRRSGPT